MPITLPVRTKRNTLLNLGIIDPIDISPIARQAFNWLYDEFVNNCDVENCNVEDVKNKFKNLVRAYGGAIICNMFVNHKSNVKKVFNWKSGYFFEKQIHKIYNIDQLIKIKNTELNKTISNYYLFIILLLNLLLYLVITENKILLRSIHSFCIYPPVSTHALKNWAIYA